MFAVVLKDYIEHLHDVSLVLGELNLFEWLVTFFAFVVKSIWLALCYIVSLHWITDFIELPASFKHYYIAVVDGKVNLPEPTSFLKSLFRSRSVRFDQLVVEPGFYSFLDTSPLNTKTIISGFLNSFFLSLPVTVPHLLSARALLVNGIPAGVASFLGTMCGQVLFFSFVLFGLESFLQPFFQFEPLIIVIGIFITLEILCNLAEKPDFTLWSILDTNPLGALFRTQFILAWFEQVCVANYFGNLTFTNSVTALETTEGSHFIFVTLTYLFGLIMGCCIWSLLFGFLLIRLRTFLADIFSNVSFMEITEKLHYGLLTSMFAFAITTFPYYGYDFFTTNTLGYVHQDSALEWSNPRNRHLVPGSYKERSLLDDRSLVEAEFDPRGEILLDSMPFQDIDRRPASLFERYALSPETDWINKADLLDRAVEKQGGKGRSAVRKPYVENPIYRPQVSKAYVTPELTEDDFYFSAPSEQYRILEILTDSMFRIDVNVKPRDAYTRTYTPETQVLRQFREKYYSNPVYKSLIKANHISFSTGQSKEHRLSAKDEVNLYKRRIMLQDYLDSVSRYHRIIEDRSVAYPEKVYNQQFKGSLSYIRRFNAVRLHEYGTKKTNPWIRKARNLNKKVVKYDQPLYKTFKNEQAVLLHEELPFNEKDLEPSRFLKLNQTQPLYIGWDDSLRKFMVKGVRVGNSFLQGDSLVTAEDKERNTDSVFMENEPVLQKTKGNLPQKYIFQAWSPGVEEAGPGTQFKLPELMATKEEILKLQVAFEFIDDIHSERVDMIEEQEEDRTLRFGALLKRVALREFFTRLPLYDWYWGQSEQLAENRTALRIGDAVPPKLDGIAWPGKNERHAINRDIY